MGVILRTTGSSPQSQQPPRLPLSGTFRGQGDAGWGRVWVGLGARARANPLSFQDHPHFFPLPGPKEVTFLTKGRTARWGRGAVHVAENTFLLIYFGLFVLCLGHTWRASSDRAGGAWGGWVQCKPNALPTNHLSGPTVVSARFLREYCFPCKFGLVP